MNDLMTVAELMEKLSAIPNPETTMLMLGVKPLTLKAGLLVRNEPWDDDVLIWGA